MIDYVFAGSDHTAATVLQNLSKQQLPKLVITREDAAYGRKRQMRQTVVADVAESLGVKTIKANNPESALNDIHSSTATRGIVVSYGAILKNSVLDSLEWFNLHFSLLPKLRGAAPVQRAILGDVAPTGVTVFKIDAGMDTGPIYSQFEVNITGLNTAQALEKMTQASHPILSQLLTDKTPDLTIQEGQPSFAPKLTREECELDPSKDSQTLLKIVLAAYPEPVAWIWHNGHPLRILQAKTTGFSYPEENKEIGRVEKLSGRVYLNCAGHTKLELLQVQPFSKRPMPATNWFNGVGEAILGN